MKIRDYEVVGSAVESGITGALIKARRDNGIDDGEADLTGEDKLIGLLCNAVMDQLTDIIDWDKDN